jgi:hypothetical protein
MYSLALASFSLASLEGFSRTFFTGSGKFAALDVPENEELFALAAGSLLGGWHTRVIFPTFL